MSARARPTARLAPSLLPAGLVALAIVALGVFHVWSRTRVLSTGYALGELQKEHVRLTSEHDRLRIEVETLRSPAVLERFARTKLGMAPPAPGAVQAAGPRLALAGGGGKDVDGVTHPGPAEPARSRAMLLGRAGSVNEPGPAPDVRARPRARGSADPLVVAARTPRRK